MRQDGPVADQRYVYLLWHGDDVGVGAPEPKLLGVYSTEAGAEDRIDRTLREGAAGFVEFPGAFHIDRYEIDKDEWVEGYVEVE